MNELAAMLIMLAIIESISPVELAYPTQKMTVTQVSMPDSGKSYIKGGI